MTNGEDVRVVGFMKPISTLMKPLRSVDLTTMSEELATIEQTFSNRFAGARHPREL